MCLARPEALSRAKPGPFRPGQAGPRCGPSKGFGPAQERSKPEPAAQARASTRCSLKGGGGGWEPKRLVHGVEVSQPVWKGSPSRWRGRDVLVLTPLA